MRYIVPESALPLSGGSREETGMKRLVATVGLAVVETIVAVMFAGVIVLVCLKAAQWLHLTNGW